MNENHIIKLTFTGDIMCSQKMDVVSLLPNGLYDYEHLFKDIKKHLSKSNYVVANLETTISGKDLGYTSSIGSYNTPESFLSALKSVGVDFVTTANNHILDRGIEGVKNTIMAIRRAGLRFAGTRLKADEKIEIVNFGNCKVAILSFTYGTNSELNGNMLSEDEDFMVDMLRKQPVKFDFQIYPYSKIRTSFIRLKRKFYAKLGRKIQKPTIDTASVMSVANPINKKYEDRAKHLVELAKQQSDIIIVCLHSGGQYNSEVGEYTKYVIDMISSMGVDAIITNHPHCVLPITRNKNTFIAQALGNFTYTPDEWTIQGVYSNYNILINLYVNIETKRITKYTFSIIKNVEHPSGIMIPKNIIDIEVSSKEYKLLSKDVKNVLKRLKYKGKFEIREEYELKW